MSTVSVHTLQAESATYDQAAANFMALAAGRPLKNIVRNASMQDHAFELLDAVAQKSARGEVKDISNYISATISRGYVPRSGGGGCGGCGGMKRSYAESFPKDQSSAGGDDTAASALINSRGMQQAEAVGLQLTDEAVHALLTVPTSHASEILEAVAEKHTELRDPSNYVVATIRRGYIPRGAEGSLPPGKGVKGKGKGGDGGFGGGSFGGYGVGMGSVFAPQGHGGGKGERHRRDLVPTDVTAVESAVLELNDLGLFPDQPLNVSTLLTLRIPGSRICVYELELIGDKAMEMVENLKAKGIGKGKAVSNPNNYLQAAVCKVVREGGGSGISPSAGKGGANKNYTGNQSRQRAEELGLMLDDESSGVLARMPLRSAMQLLEGAAEARRNGEDPILYIHENSGQVTGNGVGEADKRIRLG
eukprot:s22_g21.t1